MTIYVIASEYDSGFEDPEVEFKEGYFSNLEEASKRAAELNEKFFLEMWNSEQKFAARIADANRKWHFLKSHGFGMSNEPEPGKNYVPMTEAEYREKVMILYVVKELEPANGR